MKHRDELTGGSPRGDGALRWLLVWVICLTLALGGAALLSGCSGASGGSGEGSAASSTEDATARSR